MSKTIAIAGLGWLGKPLAQHLALLGYKVKGSVTSLSKATTLQKSGFNVFPVEISETGVTGEPQSFLNDADVLIIMIPPGLRRNTGADHVLKMSYFLSEITAASVNNVILISSTSVYDDSQGKVSEEVLPKPTSEAGKQLLQVEQLLFNAPNLKTTIVRFGGLYGGNRQPVRYLAGRTDLSNGNAPVNLIHRDDCIRILSEIIRQEAFGKIFNAVTPQHPSKREYYSNKAREIGLDPPKYSEEKQEIYKQVDSVNLERILNYKFKVSL